MRQVDACDFCGDAPDGVFEVVPAAVPDGPVRLALCAGCRTTLETVVDPLLAADASDATAGESADGSRESDAGSTDGRTATPGTDDAGTATTPGTGDVDAVDTAPNTPATDADAVDTTSNTPATDASDTAPNTPTTVHGSGDEDGADDEDGEDPDAITIEEQGGGTPAERPDGYAQLLRLLENRDGGMARDDLRALATNAYDLTDRTFEAAVDAAIENGDVEDTTGGLRRT